MNKLCSQWIPRHLTEAQKMDHVTWCNAMHIRLKEGAPKLAWDIVTVPTWLAPCDFFLFAKIENQLRSQRFSSPEEAVEESTPAPYLVPRNRMQVQSQARHSTYDRDLDANLIYLAFNSPASRLTGMLRDLVLDISSKSFQTVETFRFLRILQFRLRGFSLSHFRQLEKDLELSTAFVNRRNGSATFDGQFLINTGAEDFSRLGDVEKWHGTNRTHYEGECGAVKGSTGELWAPEMGQPEITLFASDLCTYMYLAKDSEISVEGIDGVRYATNLSTFDNGHHYPSMACYCNGDYEGDCLPPGALNVSLCRFGAPAFVSQPHFFNADPIYVQKVDGLDPKPEHRFSVGLEMFTGMPLQVTAQLQINLFVRRVNGFTIINKLPPDTLVPMFWFRQEVRVTPEYATMARRALNIRYGMMYGLYALTGVGMVLLMIGIFLLVRRLMKSPDTTPILQNDGSTSGEASD
ncbi:Protein croquemort [Eumeta japonica]|uniref:Protein croquemort n=1 Tax=Eumeta variegata TaxID=151549 RepID=A0A4C1SC46_EUMVA|nr:Protein croquemort [Eumeta japonica]